MDIFIYYSRICNYIIQSSALAICILLMSFGLLLPRIATSAPTDDFVITVKTDSPGTSSDTQFIIPTYSGKTYNYSVDWDNDGTDDVNGATGDVTCNYTSAGTYSIRIKGTFPRIYFNNEKDKNKIISVEQWGTGTWTSMGSAFYGNKLLGTLIGNTVISDFFTCSLPATITCSDLSVTAITVLPINVPILQKNGEKI